MYQERRVFKNIYSLCPQILSLRYVNNLIQLLDLPPCPLPKDRHEILSKFFVEKNWFNKFRNLLISSAWVSPLFSLFVAFTCYVTRPALLLSDLSVQPPAPELLSCTMFGIMELLPCTMAHFSWERIWPISKLIGHRWCVHHWSKNHSGQKSGKPVFLSPSHHETLKKMLINSVKLNRKY